MKKLNVYVASLFVFTIFLNACLRVFAVPTGETEQVQRKQQLVPKAEQAYSLPDNFDERDTNTARGKAILLEIATGKVSAGEMEDALHILGFFALEQDTQQQPPIQHVEFYSPAIYYNVNHREWYVIGGGRWVDSSSYFEGMPTETEIGGYDIVGMEFLNAGKSFSQVSGKRSFGAYTNEAGKMVETHNLMPGATRGQGCLFAFQDLLARTGADGSWRLQGERFAAIVVYGSDFADVPHGVPKVYFAHTGRDTYIQDFQFGKEGLQAVFMSANRSKSDVAGFDNTHNSNIRPKNAAVGRIVILGLTDLCLVIFS
ncbi:MAG: hypothetical protein ACLSAP_01245 [Oscillospiraceae bacterium]